MWALNDCDVCVWWEKMGCQAAEMVAGASKRLYFKNKFHISSFKFISKEHLKTTNVVTKVLYNKKNTLILE